MNRIKYADVYRPIKTCVDHYNDLRTNFDLLNIVFGTETTAKLPNDVWMMVDDYIATVAELVNGGDWISWWIFDNEQGKARKKALCSDDRSFYIPDIAALTRLIIRETKLEQRNLGGDQK